MLLLSREKLEFPPIGLPLTLFFLITIAAVLFSANPQGGTPQIRKFFIFAIVLVIYNTFRTIRQVQALVLAWAGVASLSAAWGVAQFLHRRQDALEQHADNYGFYIDGRITGFTSHWMTFGGEEMIVLLMLASFLFFSNERRWKRIAWPVLGILWAAIVLGMTRCIFLLGVPLGALYLLWRRRRLLAIAVPALALLAIGAAPPVIHERVVSVFKPHGDLDSNGHRTVTRIVGWQMVKAHPWLGLGPEQIGRQFSSYIPPSVPRPLPNGWYGHLHNIYLQYAAERGVPGLFFILWMIGKILLDLIRSTKNRLTHPESRFVLHGAVAVIIAILAEGFFEYNLGDSEVLTMFLSVVACGYVVMRCDSVALARVTTADEEPLLWETGTAA